MTGHRAPRRKTAGPHVLPSRRRPRSPYLLLPAVLVVAALLAGGAAAAGCGSGATDTAGSTTSVAGAISGISLAPETTEPAQGTFPVTLTDDSGNSVTVASKPMRIVSTAPASTETLFALGVGDRVVGVTSLDDYPPEAAGIAKIGDFQPNAEAIMALSPDLVVGYAVNEEALSPIRAAGAAVLIFDPTTVERIYGNISMLGAATGATAKAAELVESIKAQIKAVGDIAAASGESPKVFYALDNTLWTCGPGSFVDELLTLAHCTNVGSASGAGGAGVQAYYQFSPEQLIAADPDLILLPSSSGYKSADEFTSDSRFAGLTAVKTGHVYLFDDTTVTRPGARIGEGFKILVEAIHPGAF